MPPKRRPSKAETKAETNDDDAKKADPSAPLKSKSLSPADALAEELLSRADAAGGKKTRLHDPVGTIEVGRLYNEGAFDLSL